jgi:hypothetical protein
MSGRQVLQFNCDIMELIGLMRKKMPSSTNIQMIEKVMREALEADSMTVYLASNKFIVENKAVFMSCDHDKIKAFCASLLERKDASEKAKKVKIDAQVIFKELVDLYGMFNQREQKYILETLKKIVSNVEPLTSH